MKIPEILQQKATELEQYYLSRLPEAAPLVRRCFLNTIETTVKHTGDDYFVITGDIPAMWLRDSTSQISHYVRYAGQDPDLRQMDYIEKEDSRFRRLCFFPQLVHDSINGEVDFYLTASPECSSCLEPDTERLRNWNIAPFFQVTERRRMKSVTLPEVMRRLNLARIDALKSDSQGMDLRLLASLDGMDLITTVTAVATCFNNVGPGLSGVGPVQNFSAYSCFSKLVLSLDMLLGRLEILPLLMLMAPQTWRKRF